MASPSAAAHPEVASRERPQAAGVVVYFRRVGRTYFLVLRSVPRINKHGEKSGGEWAPSKGHVNERETVVAAALRELKEETQLLCSGGAHGCGHNAGAPTTLDHKFNETSEYPLPKRTRNVPGGIKYTRWFLAEVPCPASEAKPDVTLDPAEHDASAWLELQEAKRYVQYEAMTTLLDAANARILEIHAA